MLNVKKFIETYSRSIEEIERCKKDPAYFIEKYCSINSTESIKLKDYQKQFLINLTNEQF
jgi:hypothetical protein